MILRLLFSALLLLVELSALSAQLPLMGVGPGGVGSGGGGGCAQATAFLARNGNANASATTALICGMVTDDDWANMDAVYILATDTSAHSLLNAVSTSFTLTVSGAPTFTAQTGWTNPAFTAWLDTGFNPSTAGGHFSLNSGSIGYCNLTNSTANDGSAPMGIQNSIWIISNLSGSTFYDVNEVNVPTTPATNHQGIWAASRTAASGAGALSLYSAGSSTPLATDAGASASLANGNIYILGENDIAGGSVVGRPTNDAIAFVFIGAGITGAAYARIAARVHTYMASLGLSGC